MLTSGEFSSSALDLADVRVEMTSYLPAADARGGHHLNHDEAVLDRVERVGTLVRGDHDVFEAAARSGRARRSRARPRTRARRASGVALPSTM